MKHHKKQHRALVGMLTEGRRAAGLSQDAVARKLRLSQSSIARLEAGQRSIDLWEFVSLSEALGLDPTKTIGASLRAP